MLRRLSAALLGFLVALGLSEGVLRAFFPVEYRQTLDRERVSLRGKVYRGSEIAGLEYELRPGATYDYPKGQRVRINRHGFRGPDVEVQKPEGVYRIAAVGDSFTFSVGLDEEETLPHFLQELLNEDAPEGRRFEVLNFGVPGYSTRDEALALRHRVLDFEPDLVVLVYFWNDPIEHPDNPLHMLFHEPELWERFHLSRMVAEARHNRVLASYGSPFEAYHDPDGSSWSVVERGFRDIRRATEEAGVPVLLAILPDEEPHTWAEYPIAGLHDQVRAEGEANGFDVIDLLPLVQPLVETPRVLRRAQGHTNRDGNRLYAGLLRDRILAELLLGASATDPGS